jgi:hypothetical protein
MRYFLHIVDRYGLFPDWTGCEHADRDAALESELFRSSFVFVARAKAPGSRSDCDQHSARRVAQA